jgi:DNA-binding transcriptional ArsR family regulator
VTRDPAGTVFAALADPTRRRVVHELSKDGPLTATELAKRIPVTRQAIAKHFAALEDAGLSRDPLRAAHPAFRRSGSMDARDRRDVGSAPRRVQGLRGVGALGLDGKEEAMIGPVHPEVGRELQRARREEIVRALKGCRRASARHRREQR